MNNKQRLAKMSAKVHVLTIFRILPREIAAKMGRTIFMAQMAHELDGDSEVITDYVTKTDALLNEGLEIIPKKIVGLSGPGKKFFDNLMDPEKSFEELASEAVSDLSSEQYESMKAFLPQGVLETLGISVPEEKLN